MQTNHATTARRYLSSNKTNMNEAFFHLSCLFVQKCLLYVCTEGYAFPPLQSGFVYGGERALHLATRQRARVTNLKIKLIFAAVHPVLLD